MEHLWLRRVRRLWILGRVDGWNWCILVVVMKEWLKMARNDPTLRIIIWINFIEDQRAYVYECTSHECIAYLICKANNSYNI